jgi:hypothetical protein
MERRSWVDAAVDRGGLGEAVGGYICLSHGQSLLADVVRKHREACGVDFVGCRLAQS